MSKHRYLGLIAIVTGLVVGDRLVRWARSYSLSEWKQYAFDQYLKWNPEVAEKLERELNGIREELIKEHFEDDRIVQTTAQLRELPDEKAVDMVLKSLQENSHEQDQSGAIYTVSDPYVEKMKEVYGATAWMTPTHPDIWRQLTQVEAELSRICCNLFHGDEDSRAMVTSGGTESNYHAILSYRNKARTASSQELRSPCALAGRAFRATPW